MKLLRRHFRCIGSDGTHLHYERFGSGPPMVLCDGLACDGFIWKYLTPYFSKKYEIIHWHYPGHGRSHAPTDSLNLSIARLAADLVSVQKAAEISPPIVIGHSLGVQVALETARRHPSRVRALVLLNGVSGRLIQSIDARSPLRFLIPALTAAEAAVPDFATRFFHELPTALLAALTMGSEEINRRLIRRSDLEAYYRGIRVADFRTAVRIARFAAAHDAGPQLHRIVHPTLVMGGQMDRMTPPCRLVEMAELLPNASLTVTRRGSHALPVEQPDFVNLRIQRFLDESGL